MVNTMQFVNVNNNNYTCCAKMAGKEETPTCRKKTVTWTNEMIEDLIDFIEIHPIVSFGGRYNKQNGISGRRGGCFPLYCIIMYNCTAKEIKLQKEVNMSS
jgi:hypothetical protein